MHYVIVGGGVAGTTAAEELRKLDSSSEITLISEEHHALYSRVLLPVYIKGKVPHERIFLKKETWYSDNNIEWIQGESVKELNLKNKFVELSNGRELPFDKLLLSTGTEPTLVTDDVRGVSYLRNLDDSNHLISLLKETTNRSHACIYGGGFIACEYLNIFKNFSLPTTIAFRGPCMWSHTVCKEVGELINANLIKQGIKVVPNTSFNKVVGEKQIEGFETSVGTHPCSILGIGIGVAPNLSWIKSSGIETRSGIFCDEFLRTNHPDIFAAGDVCEYFDVRFGRYVKMGNWMNAMSQGRTVAKNMFGEKTSFDLVSSYSINVLGLEIIFVGDVSRPHADQFVLHGDKFGLTEVFIRKNQVVGAVIVGRNQDRPFLTKLIQNKGTSLEINLKK